MTQSTKDVGEKSIEEWGIEVLTRYAGELLPVHGRRGRFPLYFVPIIGECRCRVVNGQWVYEPDACDYCKSIGEEWNRANLPNGVNT